MGRVIDFLYQNKGLSRAIGWPLPWCYFGKMQYLWIYMNGTRGEMCARAVVKHGWQVGALIVPADKGDFFKPLAKGIGCELIAVENVNSQPFMERVKQTRPLFGIIAGFQTIFSPQLIASHFHPVINLHAGKVPHYR